MKICDKCGGRPAYNYGVEIRNSPIKILPELVGRIGLYFDLCDKCVHKLEKLVADWLGKEPTETTGIGMGVKDLSDARSLEVDLK